MKKLVIESNVFDEIQKRSYKNLESELQEAASKLSKIVGHPLHVASLNEDYVVFGSMKNPNIFLKSHYEVTEKDTLKLNGFEKLVVSESSKVQERKGILKRVVECLFNDDKDSANENWKKFFEKLPISEMVKNKAMAPGKAPGDAGCCNADEEGNETKGKKRTQQSANRGKYGSLTTSDEELMDLKIKDDALEEWINKLPNYSKAKEYLLESLRKVASIVCEQDADSLKIKTKKVEKEDEDEDDSEEHEEDETEEEEEEEHEDDEDEDDEDLDLSDGDDEIDEIEMDLKDKKKAKGKSSADAKKHGEKVKKARKSFAGKDKDDEFVSKITGIKKSNNMKEAKELEEALLDVVVANPSLIYVSKDELKNMISNILTNEQEDNWDDELCENIAMGIKQLAHHTYADQAFDIVKFAAIDEAVGMEEEVPDDDYEAFEVVSERYFDNIYKSAEKKYNALVELAEMLQKTSTILEKDARAHGLNEAKIKKTVMEFREYSSTIMAEAKGTIINEALVNAVVGSLLTRMADDYSLNKGVNWSSEFDKDRKNPSALDLLDPSASSSKDYAKMSGDITNPTQPKSKGPKELDLFAATSADYSQMSGIHTNPLAPKPKGPKDLDLD